MTWEVTRSSEIYRAFYEVYFNWVEIDCAMRLQIIIAQLSSLGYAHNSRPSYRVQPVEDRLSRNKKWEV